MDNGKIQYLPNGKPEKHVAQMGPGKFADGSPQSFYNNVGIFKGMTKILIECELTEEAKLKAECKGFKCKKGAANCCQCWVLYNQPDFVDQESALEITCKAKGLRWYSYQISIVS